MTNPGERENDEGAPIQAVAHQRPLSEQPFVDADRRERRRRILRPLGWTVVVLVGLFASCIGALLIVDEFADSPFDTQDDHGWPPPKGTRGRTR